MRAVKDVVGLAVKNARTSYSREETGFIEGFYRWLRRKKPTFVSLSPELFKIYRDENQDFHPADSSHHYTDEEGIKIVVQQEAGSDRRRSDGDISVRVSSDPNAFRYSSTLLDRLP